jgi:hypothetical protein
MLVLDHSKRKHRKTPSKFINAQLNLCCENLNTEILALTKESSAVPLLESPFVGSII